MLEQMGQRAKAAESALDVAALVEEALGGIERIGVEL